jgi:hypothetical protein
MAAFPEMSDTLKMGVIVAPHDPGNARRFIAEYEKRPVVDDDLQAIYLKLKYFHDPGKHGYLNQELVRNRGRDLAAPAFESVRIHPAQPEIYPYEGIRDCLRPVRDAAGYETLYPHHGTNNRLPNPESERY